MRKADEPFRKWQRVVSLKLDLPFPVTDLRFSPIALAHSHQLAIAAGDVHIYNIKVSFYTVFFRVLHYLAQSDGLHNGSNFFTVILPF